MKAFIAAVICAAAIGVGALYVLQAQQETVDVAFSTRRRARRRPRTQSRRDKLEEASFETRYGADARSAGRFRLLRLEYSPRGPLERVS